MKKLIKDMTLFRMDAMDRCINLGKKFIEHFDKLFKEPNSNAKNHWISEMKNWYKSVKEIKLKQTNKPILDGELRDWFFTAGANPQDFMQSPTTEELSVYDTFTSKVISGNSIESALRSLKMVDKKVINYDENRDLETLDPFIPRRNQKTFLSKEKAINFAKSLGKEYGIKSHLDGFGNDLYTVCWDSAIEDSKLKDGAEENDKEFLKNAIEEMEGYISNWSFMTAKQKQDIGADRNQLRKVVEEYRRKLATLKDAIIPNSAKTLEVTMKRDINNDKAGDKVILKRNERGEWSDGKYIYPVNLLRTPEICEVKVVDSKTFTVKYKDRKFKVKAKDHQDAARKVINKCKDASTISEKEYYTILDKIPRFENVEIYFNAPRFGGGLEARINWSAIGSVDTDKAKKFIADLQKAVKLVDELNKKYGGFKVTYSDCGMAEVKDGAEDKEFLKNAIEEMEGYISNWSFMTAKQKQDIGADRNQLRQKVEEYRRKLATLKDAKLMDYAVTPTRRSGTDKIIYALQSDVDKNLYFYIGATFSMKDGDFSYQKYEMNGVTPEILKAELLRNGWHEVKNYPQHIIDSKKVKDASKSRAAVENEVNSIKSEIRFLEGKLRRAETPAEKGEFAAQIDNLKRLLPKREEFLRTNEQWYTDESIEGDKIKDEYVKGPRGEFKLSEKTRSELEKEGYGFHHSFETSGGRYSVMVKNNTAVACRDSKVKDKMTVERMVQIITPIVKDFAKKKGVEDYWRIHKNGKNVSVGIELGYRGLDELCDVLNKKLAPLTESYFEPADAGLIETTIFDNRTCDSFDDIETGDYVEFRGKTYRVAKKSSSVVELWGYPDDKDKLKLSRSEYSEGLAKGDIEE